MSLNGGIGKVVTADVASSNGAIHVIDAVLLPPKPKAGAAASADGLYDDGARPCSKLGTGTRRSEPVPRPRSLTRTLPLFRPPLGACHLLFRGGGGPGGRHLG